RRRDPRPGPGGRGLLRAGRGPGRPAALQPKRHCLGCGIDSDSRRGPLAAPDGPPRGRGEISGVPRLRPGHFRGGRARWVDRELCSGGPLRPGHRPARIRGAVARRETPGLRSGLEGSLLEHPPESPSGRPEGRRHSFLGEGAGSGRPPERRNSGGLGLGGARGASCGGAGAAVQGSRPRERADLLVLCRQVAEDAGSARQCRSRHPGDLRSSGSRGAPGSPEAGDHESSGSERKIHHARGAGGPLRQGPRSLQGGGRGTEPHPAGGPVKKKSVEFCTPSPMGRALPDRMGAEAIETMNALPTQADDAALLRAFSERGDRQAMNVLFARHADAAFRVALRCCRNAADAEDAVQTAFIEVLRHSAKYRGESAVRAWIFGFVVNATRHKAREEGRRAAREERASVTGELAPDDRALQDAVRHAVHDLPEHYRLPVWLHYCEGLSSPEVADALSLSENTVRSQLSRGVEELRSALATTGMALTPVALVGTLAVVAVESAPATLTSSLSGLASTAAPGAAKAGLIAKLAAGTMAAAAIVSTAAALWWGNVPDDPRPPEFSK